ncbi:hypothetical protein AB0H12_30630 [Actinosynnema sp. NPDC023794]
MTGDWDRDGDDTPGIVYETQNPRPWHLRNSNTPGVADISFLYG